MRITFIGGSKDKTSEEFNDPRPIVRVPILPHLSGLLSDYDKDSVVTDTFKTEDYRLTQFHNELVYLESKTSMVAAVQELLETYGALGSKRSYYVMCYDSKNWVQRSPALPLAEARELYRHCCKMHVDYDWCVMSLLPQ